VYGFDTLFEKIQDSKFKIQRSTEMNLKDSCVYRKRMPNP